MQRIGTRAGRGPLWAVMIAGMLATPLQAGSVTRLANDKVNVKADRVPVGQLLRELAAVTPIPNLVIEPKVEKQTVSAYLEGASVSEAVRKTLEESGIQFLLWGGGTEPLGLYVGDLSKASLPKPGTASASAAAMDRDQRRSAREQMRADRAAPAPEPPPPADDEPPADSFAAAAAASVDIGSGGGTGAAGGNGGAIAPAAPIEGLPAPVRGTASWVGADGQAHTTGYTIQGDTVVYDDPNFVSFKNSPEARAKRMNMDVTTLP